MNSVYYTIRKVMRDDCLDLALAAEGPVLRMAGKASWGTRGSLVRAWLEILEDQVCVDTD